MDVFHGHFFLFHLAFRKGVEYIIAQQNVKVSPSKFLPGFSLLNTRTMVSPERQLPLPSLPSLSFRSLACCHSSSIPGYHTIHPVWLTVPVRDVQCSGWGVQAGESSCHGLAIFFFSSSQIMLGDSVLYCEGR